MLALSCLTIGNERNRIDCRYFCNFERFSLALLVSTISFEKVRRAGSTRTQVRRCPLAEMNDCTDIQESGESIVGFFDKFRAIFGGVNKTGSSTDNELAALLKRQRKGMIISSSMMEHFTSVVPVMEAAGATRQGSKSVRDANGNDCVVDEYMLPSGKKVLAGYVR